ncbi:hypothetical protein CLU79DRAFT_721683 [Phycomyces nitens]|nr:hypothetical protein CLU79DRAFT_721683 [Phycomyces nitens]
MSYTHFKDLYINAVQFYSFNEQTNENVPINVLSLSRLNGSQEASKNDGNINAKSSVDHVDWYHFFYNLEFAFDYGPRVRKLSEEEVCKVIKYLQTSESKENTGDSEIERSIEDEVSKNDWEYDLSRGYVNFLCGSLPKYRTPLV